MELLPKKLQDALDFILNSYNEKGITLDYSKESVRYIDRFFDEEFDKSEKLKNPNGYVAKFQGVILTGYATYLAKIIILNTENSRLITDENSENWYVHFYVESKIGWKAYPGNRLLRRINEGEKMGIYGWLNVVIEQFNKPASAVKTDSYTEFVFIDKPKKSWWKLW